jgi:dolichol-phosphate mannosyltransferase
LKALVIMPCYQEAGSLEATVSGLFQNQPGLDLLIIDDASPDGTGALADQLASMNPRIFVLHRSGKLGLGSAYRAGFEWALERDYEIVIEMDADGSHQPKHLASLIQASKTADLVIGSRWVRGGDVANWPRSRILISRLGNSYARVLLRSSIRDMTAGFRVYQRDLLTRVIAEPIRAEGYAFQVELAMRAEAAGARVAEVPIVFVEREQGSSKMTAAIVLEAFSLVTRWGLQRALRKSRGPSQG